MPITKEQLQAYIDNEGEHCPYCESEHGVWDNGVAHSKMTCLNPDCKKVWYEDTEITIIGVTEEP